MDGLPVEPKACIPLEPAPCLSRQRYAALGFVVQRGLRHVEPVFPPHVRYECGPSALRRLHHRRKKKLYSTPRSRRRTRQRNLQETSTPTSRRRPEPPKAPRRHLVWLDTSIVNRLIERISSPSHPPGGYRSLRNLVAMPYLIGGKNSDYSLEPAESRLYPVTVRAL